MTPQLVSAASEDLSAFGQDPVWLVIIKAVLIFLVLVLLTLFNIWAERRVVARMQHRVGPNVNGPFGLLQSLAAGVKLALKEYLIPKAPDTVVYLLAPITAQARGSSVLLPLLMFPLVVPALLAAARGTTLVLGADPMGQAGSWLIALLAFNVIQWPMCSLLFGRVVEGGTG